MNDFKGSIAQQDISITTEVSKTATVGGNFYEGILYVTDRFTDFGENTPVYPVVTNGTYEDVVNSYQYLSDGDKALIIDNLTSLFAYGEDLTVRIIPSAEVKNFKMYAYFTYLDLMFKTAAEGDSDYVMDKTAETTIDTLKTYDKAFTALIADIPVDPTKMNGFDTGSTAGTLKLLTTKSVDMAVFARAAMPSGVAGTANAYLDAEGKTVGSSPALYQLGRSLGRINGSGTPVGNAFDMDAINFLNVLPNGNTDSEVLSGIGDAFASFFDSVSVNYFKPVGNGTMQITNRGAWTMLHDCIGANWIVAYLNYMNRVSAATIITNGGTSLKDPRTYSSLLDALVINVKPYISVGRIAQFELTAPSFSEMPKANGSTIVIPNAWVANYVDNVRNVKISGTLNVPA